MDNTQPRCGITVNSLPSIITVKICAIFDENVTYWSHNLKENFCSKYGDSDLHNRCGGIHEISENKDEQWEGGVGALL